MLVKMLGKWKFVLVLLVFIYIFDESLAQRRSIDRNERARRRQAEKKQNERERRERELADGKDPSAPPSEPLRNNRCRRRDLCESITHIAEINLEERNLLSADNSLGANEIATECFATVPDCSQLDRNYRSANGTCNNEANPIWGSSFNPFKRFLDAEYGTGGSLKVVNANPRVISSSMDTHTPDRDTSRSLMVMQFGQFLDHDITHTPLKTIFDSEGNPIDINCCNKDEASTVSDCQPIKFAFDASFGGECINFIRSAPATQILHNDCVLSQREQFNQITPLVDASNVYGSDEEKFDELRDVNGKLKISTRETLSYLPLQEDESCGEFACYNAGDDRVNEQTDLTVIHTLFVREHNRIANAINNLNLGWDSNRIFLESRKIVAGIMQNIVYDEYLPAILGSDFVSNRPKLSMAQSAVYEPNVTPNIYNEFATAAFRFGHSQVPDQLPKVGSNPINLVDVFFNTSEMNEPNNPVKALTEGLVSELSMKVDKNFVTTITDNLFRSNGVAFDLIALNIQRGRDHGLPSYNSYKARFNQPTNGGDINSGIYQNLIGIYGNSDDIDLFVGGISENAADGAAVGPLFREIIAQQFEELRVGDRFFFDNGRHYTQAAINEIRKVKLSHILCRNADLTSVISDAFFQNSNTISCSTISDVNVSVTGFFSGNDGGSGGNGGGGGRPGGGRRTRGGGRGSRRGGRRPGDGVRGSRRGGRRNG